MLYKKKNKKLNKLLKLYNRALKDMLKRIETLNLEGKGTIQYISSRIKKEESIYKKLERKNLDRSIESIKENIRDIIGIRIVCLLVNDIYVLVGAIKRQKDINILKERDYIKEPKPSGYRSYHIVLEIPVNIGIKKEFVKLEIQLRTETMDSWASLEHEIKYKYNGDVPDPLAKELRICAEKIVEIDKRMYLISDIIDLVNQ